MNKKNNVTGKYGIEGGVIFSSGKISNARRVSGVERQGVGCVRFERDQVGRTL